MPFPFRKKDFTCVERYLSVSGYIGIGSVATDIVQKKIMQVLATDKEYEEVIEGLRATFDFLKTLKEFNDKIVLLVNSPKLKEEARLCDEGLKELEKCTSMPSSDAVLNIADVIKYDHLLRGKYKTLPMHL